MNVLNMVKIILVRNAVLNFILILNNVLRIMKLLIVLLMILQKKIFVKHVKQTLFY